MTTTTDTTVPSAAITLPVAYLQALRVRTLAHAALGRIELARITAYWRSPEGRARLNAMWCGEQDAVGAEREAMERDIDGEEEIAQSMADAIAAAGYSVLVSGSDHPASRALSDIAVVRQFATAEEVGKDAFATYWRDTETRLREFIAS